MTHTPRSIPPSALPPPHEIVDRLRQMQALLRDAILSARDRSAGSLGSAESLATVERATAADTIYAIDALVEPILEEFFREWSRQTPLVLIAEGIEGPDGRECKTFPEGTAEADATLRVIVDPIDGTRGLMYDKRSAWSLAAAAPNLGPATRLRDCIVSVMTELPTAKMTFGDVAWAVRGEKSHAERVDLRTGSRRPLALRPSRADTLAHGFAMVSHFFPATKVQAGELMNHLLRHLGGDDPTMATVFDDQYICTGGQFFNLALGQDRFNADVRPELYRRAGLPGGGLCCHPYDVAGFLVAEQAGVVLTDPLGRPLDGPLDTISSVSWVGYANQSLQKQLAPAVAEFLRPYVVAG